jgi:Domain of unknown function (DUF3846)
MTQRAAMPARRGAGWWATLTVEGRMDIHDGVPTLMNLQGAVGGYVEAVSFPLAGSEATMWVNEEGKLTGEPRRNWKADAVCPLAWGDWTAGDVAFTGGVGPDGETLELNVAQVAELRRIDHDVRVLLIDERSSGFVVIG